MTSMHFLWNPMEMQLSKILNSEKVHIKYFEIEPKYNTKYYTSDFS